MTLEDNSNIMNYVNLFLGDDFFQLLQECSQEYHDQNVERMQTCDKEVNWFDLSGQELKKFMGLILRMADSPRKPIKKFWSVDDFYHQTIFGKTMSRDRFLQIWKCFHFGNGENTTNSRLDKVKPLIDQLIPKFQHIYTLERELSLDESVLPYRGRLNFKVTIFNH